MEEGNTSQQTPATERRVPPTPNEMTSNDESNMPSTLDEKSATSEATAPTPMKYGVVPLDKSSTPHTLSEQATSKAEWEDILGNGFLKKLVVIPGKGRQSRPPLGSMVVIHWETTVIGGSPDVVERMSAHVILGDGDLPQALDQVGALMQDGEVAKVISGPQYYLGQKGCPEKNIPPNATVELVITMVEVRGYLDFASMAITDRLTIGDSKRNRGNMFYMHGERILAINSWTKALTVLDLENRSGGLDAGPEVLQQVLEIRAKLLCNMSAAQIQLEAYDAAIKSAQEAIDLQPAYFKAFYRLGKAYSQKGQYEEAIRVLKKALELDENQSRDGKMPHDLQVIHDELARITKNLKKEKDNEKKVYSKMFGLNNGKQSNSHANKPEHTDSPNPQPGTSQQGTPFDPGLGPSAAWAQPGGPFEAFANMFGVDAINSDAFNAGIEMAQAHMRANGQPHNKPKGGKRNTSNPKSKKNNKSATKQQPHTSQSAAKQQAHNSQSATQQLPETQSTPDVQSSVDATTETGEQTEAEIAIASLASMVQEAFPAAVAQMQNMEPTATVNQVADSIKASFDIAEDIQKTESGIAHCEAANAVKVSDDVAEDMQKVQSATTETDAEILIANLASMVQKVFPAAVAAAAKMQNMDPTATVNHVADATKATADIAEDIQKTESAIAHCEAANVVKVSDDIAEAMQKVQSATNLCEVSSASNATADTAEDIHKSQSTNAFCEAANEAKATVEIDEDIQKSQSTNASCEASNKTKATAELVEDIQKAQSTHASCEAANEAKATADIAEDIKKAQSTNASCEPANEAKATADIAEDIQKAKSANASCEETEEVKETADIAEDIQKAQSTNASCEAAEEVKATADIAEDSQKAQSTNASCEATEEAKEPADIADDRNHPNHPRFLLRMLNRSRRRLPQWPPVTQLKQPITEDIEMAQSETTSCESSDIAEDIQKVQSTATVDQATYTANGTTSSADDMKSKPQATTDQTTANATANIADDIQEEQLKTTTGQATDATNDAAELAEDIQKVRSTATADQATYTANGTTSIADDMKSKPQATTDQATASATAIVDDIQEAQLKATTGQATDATNDAAALAENIQKAKPTATVRPTSADSAKAAQDIVIQIEEPTAATGQATDAEIAPDPERKGFKVSKWMWVTGGVAVAAALGVGLYKFYVH